MIPRGPLRAPRGIPPSVDEMRAVAADPGALPGIVDAYLGSPEFGRTIRDMCLRTAVSRSFPTRRRRW
ncbi:MAG TPA: hypothetical protein VLS89_05535 [Candidatus Nanopelagicales bacterium]|nr:hypothetical protein [Candidatus Nanopelagicales bacterium]